MRHDASTFRPDRCADATANDCPTRCCQAPSPPTPSIPPITGTTKASTMLPYPQEIWWRCAVHESCQHEMDRFRSGSLAADLAPLRRVVCPSTDRCLGPLSDAQVYLFFFCSFRLVGTSQMASTNGAEHPGCRCPIWRTLGRRTPSTCA